MEEAYNQETGVIQHISAFQYLANHQWLYTFTQEWPVKGQKHQLSATIPYLRNESTGLGDIVLNYRYQAILAERLAFSPRLSLILPTGNLKEGLGSGILAYQVNLPVSYIVSRKVVTHYNLGITYIPENKNELDSEFSNTIYNYGMSVILLLTPTFNFMLEAVGYQGKTSLIFINPGFRYAINFKSGLQIVPGIAMPIQTGSSHGVGIFAYLSFEHPLHKK